MFDTTIIGDVTIITPDVVRMNVQRSQVAGNFCKTEIGVECNPFVFKDKSGLVERIELWGGDITQRQTFEQNLAQQM